MTELTIVVPFHGDVALLTPLLDALDEQSVAELPRVIISDDASSPPVERALGDRRFGRVQPVFVRSEQNGGPGAARNRALELVDTTWVAFLDGDTVPAPDWVERIDKHVATTEADVVEGQTEMGGGGPITPFTHATEAAPPHRHVAGNIAFRTDLLRRCGGFDERYFDPSRKLHFREDADIAFRLRDAGATFEFVPELIVRHPPLPSSFWSPVKLARRYYFDPLLSREHPEQFREMNEGRIIGPVTLRRARHDAAMGFVASIALLLVASAIRSRPLQVAALTSLGLSWAANVVALSWKREIRPQEVVPLAAVAALTPFSYVWHFWRGVRHFGHRPRL